MHKAKQRIQKYNPIISHVCDLFRFSKSISCQRQRICPYICVQMTDGLQHASLQKYLRNARIGHTIFWSFLNTSQFQCIRHFPSKYQAHKVSYTFPTSIIQVSVSDKHPTKKMLQFGGIHATKHSFCMLRLHPQRDSHLNNEINMGKPHINRQFCDGNISLPNLRIFSNYVR